MPGVVVEDIRNRLVVWTTTHLNGFGRSDRHFNAGCGGGGHTKPVGGVYDNPFEWVWHIRPAFQCRVQVVVNAATPVGEWQPANGRQRTAASDCAPAIEIPVWYAKPVETGWVRDGNPSEQVWDVRPAFQCRV